MSPAISRRYFEFSICTSPELHAWIEAFRPVVDGETTATLAACAEVGWTDQEEILVYLHHLYLYRFVLPVLEGAAGRDRALASPRIVRFQLLASMLGRFLDDLVDGDSGFWDRRQAQFWYEHFLRRCEGAREGLAAGPEFDAAWARALRDCLTDDPRLYELDTGTGRMRLPERSPLPLERYPERVRYFFCLPEALDADPETLAWCRSYITALFFLYDIDDSINDLLRNVATEAAWRVLAAGLDGEGRFKVRRARLDILFPELLARARALLVACRDSGRRLGLEMGPAMIDAELAAFGLEG